MGNTRGTQAFARVFDAGIYLYDGMCPNEIRRGISSPFDESDLWLCREDPITLLSHILRLFIFCNLMGLRRLQSEEETSS